MTEISDMVGRVATTIRAEDEKITFLFSCGAVGVFDHYQACCECVEVEDVNGDWADLIGVPILVAEERVSERTGGNPPPPGLERSDDSDTWTFYTFRTIKGSVDVRWHGSSNGYYSESVDFDIHTPPEATR